MSKPGTDTANLSIKDGIAYVELDHFPVNSLATGLQSGLRAAINEIDEKVERGELKGVVVYGAGRSFCAGADFVGGMNKKPKAKPVALKRKAAGFMGLEEIKVPVVAAIHGFALGGGLELCLDCHYRVLASDAKVGLPEVNIGFLPGGQGTQRLPRIMGTDDALKLMTSGEHIDAQTALKWGVVDEVSGSGQAPIEAAAAMCLRRTGEDLATRRISNMPTPAPTDFARWRADMQKKRSNEIAPQYIINCVEAACNGPTFADGLAVERELFSGPKGVLFSPQAAALQFMFSAERAASKIDGVKSKPAPIRSVGIVGAGLMGGGIAMCCANVGMSVKILDMDEKNLTRGLGLIKSNYDRSVQRGSRTQASVDAALRLITGTVKYTDFKDCDMVVEAAFEEIGIKKDIFKQLDKVCKPGAFMCSNTSALNIDHIASVTSRPEFVMGTHFFSPANVMLLLENVRGAKTSDLTISTCMAWGKQIGKWPILVGNCPGFVGNRLIGQYSNMSRKILEYGLKPAAVDAAIENFGNKMGPFRMDDMVGLDLGIQALQKAKQFNPDENVKHAVIAAGRLGQKNKKGYYDYADGRTATPSAEVDAIVDKFVAAKGTPKRSFTDEEIVGFMYFPLINEGFKVLEEGFAQRPADIDVCYVHGYGFPRYHGGPMYYADHVAGLKVVRNTLLDMRIKPAALLEECVAAGETLAKYWPKYQSNANEQSKL